MRGSVPPALDGSPIKSGTTRGERGEDTAVSLPRERHEERTGTTAEKDEASDFLLPLFSVRGGRDLEKHEGEDGKDERLDEAHEEFKAEKRQGSNVGDNRRDDDEQHFPSKDVAKESKGKRDHFGNLADELQDPHEEDKRVPDSEEFPEMAEETQLAEAVEMRRDNRDEREREGRVQVCISAAEEGNKENPAAVMGSPDTDGPNTRQEPKPVQGDDEHKECGNEGKDPLRLSTISCDAIHEREEKFEGELDGRLRFAGHEREAPADEQRPDHEEPRHHPTHDERIGDRETAEVPDGFCRKRNLGVHG